MDPLDHAEEILSALGAKLGRDDLAFDDDGLASFVLDRRIVVELCFDEGEQLLVVGMLIGILPAGPEGAALAEHLLAANYYWRTTRWCTIGLDDTNRAVVMSRYVSLPPPSVDAVVAIVGEMAGVADHLQQEMRGFQAPTTRLLQRSDHMTRV